MVKKNTLMHDLASRDEDVRRMILGIHCGQNCPHPRGD